MNYIDIRDHLDIGWDNAQVKVIEEALRSIKGPLPHTDIEKIEKLMIKLKEESSKWGAKKS